MTSIYTQATLYNYEYKISMTLVKDMVMWQESCWYMISSLRNAQSLSFKGVLGEEYLPSFCYIHASALVRYTQDSYLTRGYWHSRISPYSLVNFSKFSVILRKLVSVQGVSRPNFCPRVGK